MRILVINFKKILTHKKSEQENIREIRNVLRFFAMNNLNIEPGENTDAHNGEGFGAILKSTISAIFNRISWNDSLDLAVRFSVPLITLGIAATFSQRMKKEQECLEVWRAELNTRQKEVERAEQGGGSRALISALQATELKETRVADKALREIEDLQQLIKQVLSIRCSLTTSKDNRIRIEQEIRARIVQSRGPLANFDQLSERMMHDVDEIFQKDARHCDLPWPLGTGDHGELYKVYRESWRLRVENQKLRKLIDHVRELR